MIEIGVFESNFISCIEKAYKCAINKNIVNVQDKTEQNKRRSSTFIKAITDELKSEVSGMNLADKISIFSREIKKDKNLYLSEFLFDIHVCEMDEI